MENLDLLLLDLAAGRLPAPERDELLARLARDPALAERYRQAQAQHALLRPLADDSFGPFFAAKVLNRLEAQAEPDDWAASLQAIFARFALLPGALALMLLLFTLAQTGLDLNGFLGLETGLEAFYNDEIYTLAP